MYLGILMVSGLAFSCSTEFIPEINEQLRLVPFSNAFKVNLTGAMLVDYVGCYVIEKSLKALFSDYKPKDIAIRRPEQTARDDKRIADLEREEAEKKAEVKAAVEKKKLEEYERRMAEIKAKWQARA